MKDYYPGNLGGNDKRYNRSHRGYGSPLTKDMNGNQRRSGYHRKKGGPDINTEALNEMFSNIKDQLRQIVDNQNRMADFQERAVAAEERNADAMERVARCLEKLMGASAGVSIDDRPESNAVPVSEEKPSEMNNTAIEGEAVTKTIIEMRENGATYDKIAAHLNTEGIPSPAGADLWNRRSVSLVYKEAASIQ